jgi:hypothetical protein
MFRKIIHILVLVLLLFSTTGVTFYKHYCGDSLISESIGHEPKKCCGDDCKACHNESKTFKLTENYEVNEVSPTIKAEVINISKDISSFFLLSITSTDIHLDKNVISRFQILDISPFHTGYNPEFLQVFRL